MNKCALDEIITFAIRKEADAANLYKIYADLAESANVKSMFRQLREEELKHEELLRNIKTKDISQRQLNDIPDMKISDYSIEEEFHTDMSYVEALMLAIKKEEKAYRLYHDLASACKEDKLTKALLTLAQEEAKHKLKLEDEYDKTVLTEN